MKIVNAPIVDLDGKQIKSSDNLDMTVAIVLLNCALAPSAPGMPVRGAEAVAWRYDIAIQLHKLAPGGEIDIKPEMAVSLKEDLLRVYPPIVCGQMLSVLDGKTVN